MQKRNIDFSTATKPQTPAKLSRPLKTPTEPFGIVLLETQYSSLRKLSGNKAANKQTNSMKNCILTKCCRLLGLQNFIHCKLAQGH